MAGTSEGARVGSALSTLLLRSTRQHVTEHLVDGVSEAVTVTTYPVLAVLAHRGPSAISDLAREVGLDRSVVSRHADVLESARLVTRQAGTDARMAVLTLTPVGRRAVATMQRRLVRLVDRELSTWPARRVAAFTAGLEALVEQLSGAAEAP